MSQLRPLRLPPEAPEALHERAIDNLRFIRETMESAAAFTAVSGAGTAVIGLTAMLAAGLAAAQTTFEAWAAIWLADAVVALTLAGWAMDRKSRRAGVPLLSGPGRKFALSFAPPIVVGAVLTAALYQVGAL